MGLSNLFKKDNNILQKKKIYKIKKLKNMDKITLTLFNKERELIVFSAGSSRFDDKGNYKDEFEFNKKELELLNWLLNNVKLEDYAQEIADYCNSIYDEFGQDIVVTKEDVRKEIRIEAIAIKVTKLGGKAEDGFLYPEISFYGDCKCDIERGICIGFRDFKFLGIAGQDWTL